MSCRPGTRWSAAQISERQAVLRAAGYEWDVVESLPVSEAIKTQGSQMRAHITAYKASLEALAAANITTICYNFMPISRLDPDQSAGCATPWRRCDAI